MAGESFSGGDFNHLPTKFLSDELMAQVEANVAYACTDVLIRDPSTGDWFLGDRQNEPQLGPWLVGGRNAYGTSFASNAVTQVERDLGIDVDESRFSYVTSYETNFPTASTERLDHGRDTVNAVELIDLKPEEIKKLNDRVESGDIRDEYSSGAWYSPVEIIDDTSDFPYLLKALVREVHRVDLLKRVEEEMAHEENMRRQAGIIPEEEQRRKAKRTERIAALITTYGLEDEQATAIEDLAGPSAIEALSWVTEASKKIDPATLKEELDTILSNDKLGDVNRQRALTKLGLETPKYRSDNGPALRGILRAASKVLEISAEENTDK